MVDNKFPLSSLYIIPMLLAMLLGIKFLHDFAKEFEDREKDRDDKTRALVEVPSKIVKHSAYAVDKANGVKTNTRTSNLDHTEFTKERTIKLIHKISNDYGIDPLFVQAVAQVESQYDVHAKSKTSSARGVLQVLKGTAKEYCGIRNPEILYNPEIGITCGVKILKSHLDKLGGSAYKASGAYFCGLGGLRKGLKKCYNYADKVQKAYTSL